MEGDYATIRDLRAVALKKSAEWFSKHPVKNLCCERFSIYRSGYKPKKIIMLIAARYVTEVISFLSHGYRTQPYLTYAVQHAIKKVGPLKRFIFD